MVPPRALLLPGFGTATRCWPPGRQSRPPAAAGSYREDQAELEAKRSPCRSAQPAGLRATPSRSAASATAAATSGATSRLKTLGTTYSGAELVVRDDRRDRVAAATFISSVIARRPDVERAAEDAREGEHVVDLVRVVRAARSRRRRPCPADLLGRDLRRRVRHREDDRVRRAIRRHASARDRARDGEADEDVRAREHLVGRAALAGGVRALRVRRLRRSRAACARGRSRRLGRSRSPFARRRRAGCR